MSVFSRLRTVYREEFIREVEISVDFRLERNLPIVGNNCTAGFVARDFKLRYLSPTVDSFFGPSDFLAYCEKLSDLRDVPLGLVAAEPNDEQGTSAKRYIATLDGLKLVFVHSPSWKDAKTKWERRSSRLVLEEIAILAYFGDAINDDLRKRFSTLPYKKKCLYVLDTQPQYPCEFCIHTDKDFHDYPVESINNIQPRTGVRYLHQLDLEYFFSTGRFRKRSIRYAPIKIKALKRVFIRCFHVVSNKTKRQS